MNIVHVTPYYVPAWDYGGPVRVAQALCEGLAARGHAVTVVTTDARDATGRATPAEESAGGVRVIRVRNVSNRLAWRRMFLPRGARRALRSALNEADVAHLHEARSGLNLAAGPLLRERSVPYVLTAHGSLPSHQRRGAAKRVYDALGGSRVIDGACQMHAISEIEAAQFEATGVERKRIAVVPNGIYAADYETLPDGDAFRKQLGLSDERPLVLFLARLAPIKGVDFLLDSFRMLQAQMPESVLALVGPDDGAGEPARRRVESLGLGEAVRFVEGLDGQQKLSAYRAADAYVLPSRFDVFSIGLVEAMAAGAPAIVSRGCGLAGDVEQRGAGSVVDYGDVAGLRDALIATLTEPDRAKQQAARGRDWVRRTFDWDAIVTAIEQLYLDCVASK